MEENEGEGERERVAERTNVRKHEEEIVEYSLYLKRKVVSLPFESHEFDWKKNDDIQVLWSEQKLSTVQWR